MTTIADLVEVYGLDVLDHLDRQVDVPLDTGPAPQGDVICVPAGLDPDAPVGGTSVPVGRDGVVVVSGVHDHTLVAAPGTARWTPNRSGGLIVGVVECAEPVLLHHVEHGYRRLAAGRWVIRRQQEGSEERRRMVAD
jgi:hypothetical protein